MSWPRDHRDVYLVLIGALLLSLALGAASTGPLAITIIFLIAIFKAWLVVTRFIGLAVDPHYIRIMVLAVLMVVAILYVALVPDIVWVFGGRGPA